MTITDTATVQRLQPVAFDLYRDVHKAIRSELFATVVEAGRVDPGDDCAAAALAGQVRQAVQLLIEHAEHEDGAVQPALELHAPSLAERISTEHHALEAQMELLVALADEARGAQARRAPLHELYIELAGFTSAYLAHQDVEERHVGQALEAALGVEGVLGIHMAIIGNMPPQQLFGGLAVMFPAMNVDDCTDLLGGMRATAPAEAFAAVWSLAKSVLPVEDHRAIAGRLSLA